MYGVAVYIDGELAIKPLALFNNEMLAYKDYVGGRRKQLEHILDHMGFKGISLEVPKSIEDEQMNQIQKTQNTRTAVMPAIPQGFDILSN
jgi:hypothetical protein